MSTGQAASQRVQLDALSGDAAVPRTNGELVFDAPWHARAFGLAVSLCHDGAFEWSDFQGAISEEIARRHQCGVDEYYECWLTALSTVMSDQVAAELPAREDEFRTHARDEVF